MFKTAYLLLLTTLLSANAFALTDAQKQYQDQLSSLELNDILLTTQQIVQQRETDPQVLDVLAEVLIERYPNRLSYERDTLAWACRALGDSQNPRYLQLLTNILASDPHKKLKKYAKKAVKKISKSDITEFDSYVAGTVDLKKLQQQAKAKIKYSYQDQGILYIAQNNLQRIKGLAKKMHSYGSDSQPLNDTLAQYLAQHYATANNTNADTLAWACKGLAGSGTARYKALISQVANNAQSRRVKSHCKKSLKRLSGDSNEPDFKIGELDIQAIAATISTNN